MPAATAAAFDGAGRAGLVGGLLTVTWTGGTILIASRLSDGYVGLVLLATMGIFVKAGAAEFSAAELVFYRAIVQLGVAWAVLRRGDVERGYFVRATGSGEQLREVVRTLQLEPLLAQHVVDALHGV